MKAKLPSDLLNSMEYAVFGLGDSGYERYNYAGKKLYKRLLNLGAQPILPRGDGDDQHYLGIDGALTPWSEQLEEVLLAKNPLPSGHVIDRSILPPPSFRFIYEESETKHEREFSDWRSSAKVSENTRLTPSAHFQDVRHVEFKTHSPVDYSPGDVMLLWPDNVAEKVDLAISFFGWEEQADIPFTIVSEYAGLILSLIVSR
jgi:sulfite reductase alpha subunit-like flavoprotein